MVTSAGKISEPRTRRYANNGLSGYPRVLAPQSRATRASGQRSHNYNYVNEITQRTLTGGSPVVFQYDGATGASNGNLKDDGTLIYSYDALNRPIQINRVSDGLVIATYVYDAFNRRVRKTISNGGLTGNIPNDTTDYIWSGWQVVEEQNSSNAPVRQYVWGRYIDEGIQLTTLTTLGAQNVPAGTYYLLQDLLFRAVALTNSSGTVVEAYDTDAYGNTLIYTGPGTGGVRFTDDDVQSNYGANEIIYCGYRLDPETNLYYVRARTYSPTLGRWIQRDPIGYQAGVNLYEYVGGRAVVAVDPAGMLRCVPCYVCQQTLDQEEAQAIQQIEPEAIGLGFPGDLSWKITASGTLALVSRSLWGRPIGAAVGLIFGLVGIIGKAIELGALMQQHDAEIRSDIAAYKNCMKNCSN
jgi:RHS repeat-associated protein